MNMKKETLNKTNKQTKTKKGQKHCAIQRRKESIPPTTGRLK